MKELKERFIERMEKDSSLLELTWPEIESYFNIPSTGRPGDRARKWWRKHLQKGQTFTVAAEDVPALPQLKVRRTWQVQGKNGEVKWLTSYEASSAPQVEEIREKLIKDIAAFSPTIPTIEVDKTSGRLLEIAIPDYHIGRDNLQEAENRFLKVLLEILMECSEPIERILLPVGNDWLNTDTLDYTTTRGTKQFDVAPWYETFRYGWQTLAKGITLLSQYAPVDVIVVPGNHDRSRMFYIGDVLMGYFKNNERVTIQNDQEPFKFYRYGKNLIMFEHGELKPHVYPLIMADERRQDWAETDFREVHVGHFHKEMLLDEFRGVKVRFLPSLSHESDWEKQSGYRHQKQAQALVWDKELGLRQILTINK